MGSVSLPGSWRSTKRNVINMFKQWIITSRDQAHLQVQYDPHRTPSEVLCFFFLQLLFKMHTRWQRCGRLKLFECCFKFLSSLFIWMFYVKKKRISPCWMRKITFLHFWKSRKAKFFPNLSKIKFFNLSNEILCCSNLLMFICYEPFTVLKNQQRLSYFTFFLLLNFSCCFFFFFELPISLAGFLVGAGVMAELGHLMTRVAEQSSVSTSLPWQHPSDLTSRYAVLRRSVTNHDSVRSAAGFSSTSVKNCGHFPSACY